jgi:hypothetical protein
MVHALYVVTTAEYQTGSTPLDGDLKRVEVIDSTPDGGGLIGGMGCGRPVSPESMPTKIRWDEGHLALPDFQKSRCITLSERAKELIERFEPSTHQFFPVDFFNNIDGNFLERRYILNVCNRIDSMDHDKTTYVMRNVVATTGVEINRWMAVNFLVINNEQHLIPPNFSHDTKSCFVFSLAKIGNNHLWFDKHLYAEHGPWMSDALAEAIMHSGMTGLKLPNKGDAV